jgi:carbon-monoxide dehydrogenase large subunit
MTKRSEQSSWRDAVIGKPVKRVEDRRFLVGQGRYVDDMMFSGELHGVVLHSPHAHARILSIDASDAIDVDGVVRVFTGEDVEKAGLGGMPAFTYPEDWGGPSSFKTSMPILARDIVRFVGDRVAFIVAETHAAAVEAASLVRVDYEPLDAIASTPDAMKGPRVWPDCADNTSFTLTTGNARAANDAFSRAKHVVQVVIKNQRLAANPMEPRASIGLYDPADDRYTLWTTSQNPHGARRMVAAFVLKIPEASLRVVSPDVGGGFGAKANAYPEDALVVWAAKICGRPVRWTCGRTDAMATDNHGRDQFVKGDLALDESGRILALRVNSIHALGAYFISAAASPARTTLRLAPSLYRVPEVHGEARAVFTHTTPVGVYRGAGRPEANLLIERLLDRAALACGLDQAEIRRRNLIPPDVMPHTTATGAIYDTGDFNAIFEECLARADWEGFVARRETAKSRGMLLGRAVGPYIEYGGVGNERMELRIDAEARATIFSGTHAHGQGHATTYAQIIADRLALPMRDIHFVQGDTDRVAIGRGTYAGRSSMVGGCALALAADVVLTKAKKTAAFLMRIAVEQVGFAEGLFRDLNSNASVNWPDVARACHGMMTPPGMELGLDGAGTWGAFPPNYPNGCHACEIEVDPDTGEARITNYIVVDDVGVIINPAICEGQIHGGLAQGIGQALMEEVAHGRDGQLLSGGFLDYAMPRASDLPRFDTSFKCVPSSTNVLGIKAVGESSVVSSPSVVVNALLDALRPLGVVDIDMPATPARVFGAIRKAARAST